MNDALSRALQLHQEGQLEEARRAYETLLASDPDNADANHLLGLVLYQQGDPESAQEHVSKAVALRPDDAVMRNNFGEVLRALGRNEEAAEQFRRAVTLKPDYPEPHNNLAVLMAGTGHLRQARWHCEQALAMRPDYPDAWFNLGLAWQMEGGWSDAASCYERCIEHGGVSADLLNNLALSCQQQGYWKRARDHYRHALSLDDSLVSGLNNLAELCEKTGVLEEAAQLNARALAGDPDDPHALLVAARLRLRNDDAEGAVRLLRRAVGGNPSDNLAQSILFELGQLLDRRGDYPGAHEALARANRLQSADPRYPGVNPDRFHERVRSYRSVTPDLKTGRPDRGAPVFMLGFPRSGTTLLDQILDAHPALQVMEERPCLETVQARLEKEIGPFPACLSNAGDSARTTQRAAYAECASGFLDRRGGARLVDKYPLNIIRTPLIQWLFPGAPVILSLRHPCDVVLSCFMQQFVPNDAMANFASIEDAARLYAEVMELWETNQDQLGLSVHTVRYEDLLADFDETVSHCLEFLGLEWTDGVRDFAEHARKRDRIVTPSYRQVTRSLYDSSLGRWRNYRDQFGGALQMLEPFVSRFGYSLD